MAELSEHLDRNEDSYIYIGNKNIIIYATAIFMPQGSFTLGIFLSTGHSVGYLIHTIYPSNDSIMKINSIMEMLENTTMKLCKIFPTLNFVSV